MSILVADADEMAPSFRYQVEMIVFDDRIDRRLQWWSWSWPW